MTNNHTATQVQEKLDHNGTSARIGKKSPSKHAVGVVLDKLQKIAQGISTKKGVRECSKFATGRSVKMRVDNKSGNVRFTGLNRCLNSTSCPRCSHILGTARAKGIDSVAVPVIEGGGAGVMVTLTIPHHRKDKFIDLRRVLNKSWDALMRQKFGITCGKFNRNGKPLWVKSFDYTWGRNGDHLHFHCMILFEAGLTEDEFTELEDLCTRSWIKLVKKNFRRDASPEALKFERAYDVEGISKYNDKISSVAFEIASRGTTKQSKSGSMNVWELLWLCKHEPDDAKRKSYKRKFRQYEKDTHKLRTISYSKSFKERLDETKLSKEEVIEKQDETSSEVLAIRNDLWALVNQRGDRINLLELFNSYFTGDEELKPIIEEVMKVCNRYGEDSNNYNEEQMSKDWGDVSWKITLWMAQTRRRERTLSSRSSFV
jgi:hypothetical protein